MTLNPNDYAINAAQMQKILILVTKSNWGGAQRYVYDLATSLPKDSYAIEVMAGGNGILIDRLNEAGIKADGSLPIGRDVNLFQDIKAFLKLWSLLWEKKPDILHINSSKIGILGALAGRCAGIKKIVFTCHGWAFNENKGFAWKILMKAIYWLTLLLSHKTITVSEALKYQVRNWPLVQDKVIIIHNGIIPEPIFSKANARMELMKMSPNLNSALTKIDPKKTLIVGTIAELHPIKGYDYALRGINDFIKSVKEKNPQLTVIYIVMGEGDERAKLEKTIVDLDLQNNVFLMGHVINASHYLKALDIFLLASLSEGLAYVLIEAGFAGLPVLATTVGGIPEIIDDMESGVLIQSRKAKEIQHGLEFYMTHKKTQKEYASSLQKKVVAEFTIKEMIEKTIKTYSSTNL
ncbi:MAG: glycosyltransferase [Patescibacteria group bacterium]